MVIEIHESMQEIAEDSRKFNQREMLFGNDITEYSKVRHPPCQPINLLRIHWQWPPLLQLSAMQKEFTPYYNLWKIVDFWTKGYQKWMFDEFDTVNAEECDKFVEDSVKMLSTIARNMKDKELPQI